jgi:hypothetical protein
MLISLIGLGCGFVLWIFVRKKLRHKTGRNATMIFFVCLGLGLVLGLWGDGETIRAIFHVLQHGPAPQY